MTSKPDLSMWVDDNDDDNLPPEYKAVSDKVRPLLNEIANSMYEEDYTFTETMSLVTSIIGKVYDTVLQDYPDKKEYVRTSVEQSIKMTLNSCERGHKRLQ